MDTTQPVAPYTYKDLRCDLLGNRPLEQKRVNRIKRSMRKHGYIPSCPVQHTSDLQVVIGQHRLEAAKQLGLVPTLLLVDDMSPELIADESSFDTRWTPKDCLASAMAMGNVAAGQINALINEFNAQPRVISAALHAHIDVHNLQAVVQFAPERMKEARKVLTELTIFKTTCKPKYNPYGTTTLIAAYTLLRELKACDGTDFSYKTFCERMQHYALTDFIPYGSVKLQLQNLIEIYNSHTRKPACLLYAYRRSA